MAVTPTPPPPSPVISGSYVDWAAILGGALMATALTVVLLTFGSGLGLSLVSLEPGEGISLRWVTIASGIWIVWVAVTSFAAGGYLAGRLRRRADDSVQDEVETRDGAHGLLVWATGALIGVLLASSGISGVTGAAGSAASGVASATGSAAGSVTSALEGQIDYYADRLLRNSEAGAPAAGGGETDTAEIRDQIMTILTRSLQTGEIAEGDQEYLATLVSRQTGVPQEEVSEQVDAALAEFEQARQAAIDAAEQARVVSVIAAFTIAATLLVSALAAYLAATYGGEHRDRNTPLRSFGR